MTFKTIRIKRIAILAVLIAGCVPTKQITSEEQAYLTKAMSHPTEFMLSKNDASDAWGRANLYLAKYSSMKLQTASDMLLTTYNPVGGDLNSPVSGYTITKSSIKDSVLFTVSCTSHFDFGNVGGHYPAMEERNAHMASLYITTGEIMPSLIDVPKMPGDPK